MSESISSERKRHTPQQIIDRLREADVPLSEGLGVAEVAARLGVSEVTCGRWRNQLGGMKSDQMKRLKEPEQENRRLKGRRGSDAGLPDA